MGNRFATGVVNATLKTPPGSWRCVIGWPPREELTVARPPPAAATAKSRSKTCRVSVPVNGTTVADTGLAMQSVSARPSNNRSLKLSGMTTSSHRGCTVPYEYASAIALGTQTSE
jgi:hypothetical protein